jgi:hypothetical protein
VQVRKRSRTDWWNENPVADTAAGHTGAGPDLRPRREDWRDSAPTHREVAGSGAAVDFGITEWTPYRRPWYRKTSAITVIGAVVAIAVTAVVLVAGRDGSAAGDETTVAPAVRTSSGHGPTTGPPHSARSAW